VNDPLDDPKSGRTKKEPIEEEIGSKVLVVVPFTD
jgi:hypothetical protein